MCVIVAKPSGIKMPTQDQITDMWYTNPDGAGFMYEKNGTVYIRKGFMYLQDFLDALDRLATKHDLTELPIVMHFRITTHGGTKPENCHPFPITDSLGVLTKLDSKTKLGVAHNGIIPITPRKDISDTMEYILSQLAPLHRAVPKFYANKDLMEMVYNAVHSKLAFLTDKGEIFTVGDFQERDGILYSNLNHEWSQLRSFKYSSTHPYDWDSYDWDSYDWSKDNGAIRGTFLDRTVMWVDEDIGYITGVDDIDPGYGMYALDCDNNVYEYDEAVDALVMIPGATLHSNTGTTIRFNLRAPSTMRELVFDPYVSDKDEDEDD